MLFKGAMALAWKDLYTEWKTKQTISTMLIFAGLVVIVFSFAFDPMNTTVKAIIPGLIWVIIVFAGLLGLNRSFTSEGKNDTIHALIVAPLDPSSIYLGKFISNLVMILIVEIISIPFLFILFDFKFHANLLYFILTIFIGTFGFVSAGTFLAALSSNSRSSEMLLPIILFPISTPILIGAVQATKIQLISPDKFASAISWMQLITAYDLIIFVACFILYEYVQEV
ncbi:MAG: cytochrome c-type biosis protein CcmB [Bacillales bacterium]|jgi:heme exporter protein B|nr:cytochrome c-type biosis protein CcmB [Bacillales bacterium]